MTFFEHLKSYVGFTEQQSQHLQRFRAVAAPHFPHIIDDFYDAVRNDPGALAIITGGEAQIARLKETLLRWIDELLAGPHDENYFERRARIGRVHVRIGLPQEYMLTATNRIRSHLQRITLTETTLDEQQRVDISLAINQVLDMDLAIMLETYREDLMTKNLANERLATLGQFAVGIGHELRNPLSVIESSVFLLRQRLGANAADEGVRRHLDRITNEVQRSNKTIIDLLELVRNRPPNRVRTRVREVIDRALNIAQLQVGVAVEVDCAADLYATLDPGQIEQVLSNLFINAEQAMANLPAPATPRLRIAAWSHGEQVAIRVQDAGPGVPVEIRERIFQPLFTTRAKGTGIGLALCRKILEAHGGKITLEEPTAAPARLDLPGASFLLLI